MKESIESTDGIRRGAYKAAPNDGWGRFFFPMERENKMKQKQQLNRKKLVAVSLFAAIAYAVMVVVHFPVSFLTLDLKDTVITLCGLYFGPLSALFVSVFVPFLEMITVSSTGVYGFLMNMIASATFSVTVSVIYKTKKSLLGAVVGLISGVCALTAVMMLANLVITPYYMGVNIATVRQLIPVLLLPFNLIKATLNAALVMLLYKPVSLLLQQMGFLKKSGQSYRMDLKTVLVLVLSLALIMASIVVIVVALGGRIRFGV